MKSNGKIEKKFLRAYSFFSFFIYLPPENDV